MSLMLFPIGSGRWMLQSVAVVDHQDPSYSPRNLTPRIVPMPLRGSLPEVLYLLGDTEANAFIYLNLASEMVDSLLGNSSLSAVILKQIELYLACHLYTQTNPDVVRESYDNASFQYLVASSGKGFCSTKWGQMAESLDTTGRLSSLGKTQVAVHVI
jgi:hypothetical protein